VSIDGVWRRLAAKRARHACGTTVAAEMAIWSMKFKTYKDDRAAGGGQAQQCRNKPGGRLGKVLHRASRAEIRDNPEEVSAVREKRPNSGGQF